MYCAVLWIDPDSDLDPKDPYDFGNPGAGSGSVSQMYGSWSFYHQAKIVGKTWILLFWDFFMEFYIWKNDVNLPSYSNKQKK